MTARNVVRALLVVLLTLQAVVIAPVAMALSRLSLTRMPLRTAIWEWTPRPKIALAVRPMLPCKAIAGLSVSAQQLRHRPSVGVAQASIGIDHSVFASPLLPSRVYSPVNPPPIG